MTRPPSSRARRKTTHDRSQLRAITVVALVAMTFAVAFGVWAWAETRRNSPAPSSSAGSSEVTPPAGVDATLPVSAVETTPTTPAPAPPPAPEFTVAWQPSHQDDTGSGWHEWEVCGDIVDRTMALLPEFDHAKAWETQLGLTGTNNYRPNPTNTPAFDSEINQANAADADVFVSVHVDGGAPSGILGECMPNDAASRKLCEAVVDDICKATGLPNRGVREVRLYSLETPRNQAPLRILLELGDNQADRALLMSDDGRNEIAKAVADAVRTHVPEVATK